jgi:hypothetical protein
MHEAVVIVVRIAVMIVTASSSTRFQGKDFIVLEVIEVREVNEVIEVLFYQEFEN